MFLTAAVLVALLATDAASQAPKQLSPEEDELVMFYAEHVDRQRWAGSYLSSRQMISIDKTRLKQVSEGYFDVWLRHDYPRKDTRRALSFTHEEFNCRDRQQTHIIEGVNYSRTGKLIGRVSEAFVTLTPESEGEALYTQVCEDLAKLIAPGSGQQP